MTPIDTIKYRLAIQIISMNGTSTIYIKAFIDKKMLAFTDSEELSTLFVSKLGVAEFYKCFETQINEAFKGLEQALGTIIISKSINIETIKCTFEPLNIEDYNLNN